MMPLNLALEVVEACCWRAPAKDTAIGALRAIEAELEKLRVCGNCQHTHLYHEYCEELARADGRLVRGHPQPNGNDLVDCADNCHFDKSHWTKRTNEPLP